MDATEIIIQTQEIRRRLRTAFNALDGIHYPADDRSEPIKLKVMKAKRELRSAINDIEKKDLRDRGRNQRYEYRPDPFFNHERRGYPGD